MPAINRGDAQAKAIATGFINPVYVTPLPINVSELCVVERRGLIWILDPESGNRHAFLDLTQRVRADGSERDMFSVAFYPDVNRRPSVFVAYTTQPGGTLAVEEYAFDTVTNVADRSTHRTILEVAKPASDTHGLHAGGQLRFGPKDGYLYVIALRRHILLRCRSGQLGVALGFYPALGRRFSHTVCGVNR